MSEYSQYGLDESTLKEILSISTVEVKTADTYKDGGNAYRQGLMDPRMSEEFGHIVLALPVVPHEGVRVPLPVKQIEVLPVPPIAVRPSITLDNGDRSEDDLTHKLVDVLRINQRLRENRDVGAPQTIVEDLHELLTYHVSTYLDNELEGWPPARHRSGRPIQGVYQFCSN